MHINMNVTADKATVLEALRKNREEHQVMVKEAREGYVEKARAALAAKLDELRSGKLAALEFGLVMPVDYTDEYDTAIRMLELEKGDEIKLDASLVRCFVLNQWGWMDIFTSSNIGYSKTVAEKFGK